MSADRDGLEALATAELLEIFDALLPLTAPKSDSDAALDAMASAVLCDLELPPSAACVVLARAMRTAIEDELDLRRARAAARGGSR